MKRLLLLLTTLTLLVATDAWAVLVFWDRNGTSAGSGGPAPTGTWSVDAYNWNTNYAGGGASGPGKWGDGDFAVFAAGSDATGAYTVTVSNVIKVADIHVDMGTVTFVPEPATGGELYLVAWDGGQLGNNTNRLLSVGHQDANATAVYNVALTNAYGIIRYKRGTLVLGVTNGFTGPLTIEGGVVKLGVPNAIPASCSLVLANNDTSRPDFSWDWQYTPAVFATAGLNQNLGPLKLAGTDGSVLRMIDLGGGGGVLSFADSSAEDWGWFTLTVTNYVPGRRGLRFGTNASGVTAAQLSQITFAGFLNLPTVIDAQGYVMPDLPRVTAISHASGSVHLAWTAVAGRNYRVWAAEALIGSEWTALGDVYASDTSAFYDDANPTPNARFYRLEVLP